MNPFKSGFARLALMTGAPIVPATITGGRRVWRRGQLLPKPGKIRVVFHAPIRVDAAERLKWKRDKSLERAVVENVMATINRAYGPSLRKENRLRRLLSGAPGPLSPFVEGVPVVFFAAAAIAGAASPGIAFAIGAYLAWLAIERASGATGRFFIWARHLAPWLAFLGAVSPFAEPSSLALGAFAGAALIGWLTIFRFPLYRRVRPVMLAVAYGTLLLELIGRGA